MSDPFIALKMEGVRNVILGIYEKQKDNAALVDALQLLEDRMIKRGHTWEIIKGESVRMVKLTKAEVLWLKGLYEQSPNT